MASSRPRIWDPPSTVDEAITALDRWRASPSLRWLHEEAGHYSLLTNLLRAANVTGARVHDARVAAICLSHNVTELWTADRDFSAFPSLNCRNPL